MFEEEEARVEGIRKLQETIERTLSPERREELSRKLDLGFEEWYAWQNAQALAHAAGRLTVDAAIFIHTCLGGSPSVFNGQSLAVKVLLTKLMAGIMEGNRQ
jgi:hypothetical protein